MAKTILIVDDSSSLRTVVRMSLVRAGYDVLEAGDGQEALTQLDKTPKVHLIVSDVNMPVMDGTQTIAEIRASDEPWANIPVIALTADAMTGDKERYLAMGMDGYLSKPIAERDLVTEITRVRSLTPEQLAENREGKMAAEESKAA